MTMLPADHKPVDFHKTASSMADLVHGLEEVVSDHVCDALRHMKLQLGTLVNDSRSVVAWFGFTVAAERADSRRSSSNWNCWLLWWAVAHWYHATSEDLHVWFGDNDASRYALIKADANGDVARAIVSYHLEVETALNILFGLQGFQLCPSRL